MKYQYAEFRMDNSFKVSFIFDLIKGLAWMHESQLGSHGNLKSCNCLIDVRWTLKIADFGLHHLRVVLIDEQAIDIVGVHKSMYWTSPELLRVPKASRETGTLSGDVYSFAIVLYEIIFEIEPYQNENPHGNYCATLRCYINAIIAIYIYISAFRKIVFEQRFSIHTFSVQKLLPTYEMA